METDATDRPTAETACQISRGFCVPKLIQFRSFLTELFKEKMGWRF